MTVRQTMNNSLGSALAKTIAANHFNGGKRITVKDFLTFEEVSAEDKIFTVACPDLISNDVLHTFVETVADKAVTNFCLTCGIEAVEDWAKRWLNGSDRSWSSAWAASEAAEESDLDSWAYANSVARYIYYYAEALDAKSKGELASNYEYQFDDDFVWEVCRDLEVHGGVTFQQQVDILSAIL